MTRDATATRERIMDSALDLVLERGYGGTSVDKVIEGAGVTKGAFFHHFKSKADLADALLDRFVEKDRELFGKNLERARQLSRDPVQRLLIFIGLYIEQFEQLRRPYPGCLYAACCYQNALLESASFSKVRDSMLFWRQQLLQLIKEAKTAHPPRIDIDAEAMADYLLGTFEGAFILGKALKDPKVPAAQLKQYRNYLELAFGVEATTESN